MRTLLLACILTACSTSSSTTTQDLGGANACIQEAAGKHLTCTANDVRVSRAVEIHAVGGGPLDSCVAGSLISFVGVFEIQLNTTARLDPRFFFGTDGDPNGDGALSGSCASNVITTSNTTSFTDLDGDACGDINTNELVEIEIDNVPCVDNDGDGHLDLPTCTSWKQPGSDTVCNTAEDTAPGSPSKCSCDAGFDVPIAVKPPEAAVTKSLVGLLCSTVQYQVTVHNASDTQTLTLSTLTDSTFGDLFAVHDDVVATTCAPAVLAVGATTSCTFDARFCGGTETDTATATLDDGAGTLLTRTSNALTVTASATAQ